MRQARPLFLGCGQVVGGLRKLFQYELSHFGRFIRIRHDLCRAAHREA